MAFTFNKANQSLDNLPFKNRLKAVGALVKNTFSVIGRDEDIIKPWIRMAVYNFLMVSFFFYSVTGNWYELPMEGWALFFAFLMFLYKHFYHNKQEVRLSWTVYQTIMGEDPSYKSATADSKSVKSQIRKLAWLDIGMALMNKGKYIGKGIVQMIMNLIIAGMEEVWDLVNHYLLPSIAIDKLEIDVGGSPTTITWVPMTIAIYLGKLFSNLFERTVTAVKVVYFTIFYTKITHPESIMEELQEELTNYLKLDQVGSVDNLDKQESVEVEAV